MAKVLPVGKLPLPLLERLLTRYGGSEERLIVGPQVGEDAAVIEFGESYLVVKTDPITLVNEEVGDYLININANDIATMGARPKWLLATLLLPEGKTTENLVEDIFLRVSRACGELGICLCGGHCEITHGLDRPIVVGLMLGEMDKEKLVRSCGARIGDDILLTKGIAIEGTSIIAREKETQVKEKFGEGFLSRVKNYLRDPGISIVKEALLAVESVEVHAMHDPTEGGLSMGLYELSIASKKGMVIYEEEIPILPECQTLCQEFNLNPLGLIASGALVITLEPGHTEKLLDAYHREAIRCSIIGKVVEGKGVRLQGKAKAKELPYFEQDEITKLLGDSPFCSSFKGGYE
ncbi:AIR synthase family protein [candidate division NPL-UPA2 bacterium]|nr:AIR synthase family protein [candidate division NPL-UPA2 bacterium]